MSPVAVLTVSGEGKPGRAVRSGRGRPDSLAVSCSSIGLPVPATLVAHGASRSGSHSERRIERDLIEKAVHVLRAVRARPIDTASRSPPASSNKRSAFATPLT